MDQRLAGRKGGIESQEGYMWHLRMPFQGRKGGREGTQ